MSIIYIATIFFIPQFSAYKWLYIVGGVSIYLVPISIDWFFQGQENFRLITIRSAVIKTLSFVGLFVFVRERDDLLAYIALSSFAIVGNQVWNIIYATKKGLKIHFKNLSIRQHLKSMGVFFLSHIAVSIIVMLDVLMLGFLSTYEQVGLFTSPNKVVIVIIMIIASINTVLLPRLSANNANKEHLLNNALLQKAFDIISLLVIPIAIGLYLCSSRFVPMFFGNEFIESVLPMQLQSIQVIVVMLNIFMVNNILVILGYESKYLIVLVFTSILSLILNIIFIPKFGAVGASISLGISQTFQVGFNLYFVHKPTSIRVKWKGMIKATICSIPIVFIYYLINKYDMINSRLLFLCFFIATSTFIYIILQIIIFKNYILKETIQLMVNRAKYYYTK